MGDLNYQPGEIWADSDGALYVVVHDDPVHFLAFGSPGCLDPADLPERDKPVKLIFDQAGVYQGDEESLYPEGTVFVRRGTREPVPVEEAMSEAHGPWTSHVDKPVDMPVEDPFTDPAGETADLLSDLLRRLDEH